MANKKFNDFIERFDSNCYEIFHMLICLIVILSCVLAFLALVFSIGCFFRLEFTDAFKALFISIISIVVFRGGGELNKKLGEKNEN